ncbi:uncharacterized protein LOC143696016 [Agelaius phoeniceus]|uniref:uncharacterized protein LOC143696016 n=1 Tax=Agelaius phoeniceus TaxID=39638 RepID=UPI004054C860
MATNKEYLQAEELQSPPRAARPAQRGSRPPDPSAPRAGARAREKVAEKVSADEKGPGRLHRRRHRGRRSRGAAERGHGRGLTCLSSAWRVGEGGGEGRKRGPPRSSRSRGDPGREAGRRGREEGRGGGSRALRCVRGAGASLREEEEEEEEEETPRPYGRDLRSKMGLRQCGCSAGSSGVPRAAPRNRPAAEQRAMNEPVHYASGTPGNSTLRVSHSSRFH